jgi:hypothetical protein
MTRDFAFALFSHTAIFGASSKSEWRRRAAAAAAAAHKSLVNESSSPTHRTINAAHREKKNLSAGKHQSLLTFDSNRDTGNALLLNSHCSLTAITSVPVTSVQRQQTAAAAAAA